VGFEDRCDVKDSSDAAERCVEIAGITKIADGRLGASALMDIGNALRAHLL
jgi:hypothetical protein